MSSPMTTATSEKKGRLELLLDEFSDVHGTVLLGMHKEIQTLKAEVNSSVETRIGEFLAKIRSADTELAKHLELSQASVTELVSLREESLDKINTKKAEAESQLDTLLANIAEQNNAFATAAKKQAQTSVIQLASLREESLDQIRKMKADAELQLSTLLSNVAEQQNAFKIAANAALDEISRIQREHHDKMAAALSYANAINAENKALLEQAQLHQATVLEEERQLHSKTQKLVIAVGASVVTIFAVITWLLQTS